MKIFHQHFVIGADGPDSEWSAIAGAPTCHVLDRIWTNRRPWQISIADAGGMQNDTRIQSHDSIGPGKQRVDFNVGDAGILYHQLAEAYQQLFQICKIHWLAS